MDGNFGIGSDLVALQNYGLSKKLVFQYKPCLVQFRLIGDDIAAVQKTTYILLII